MKQQLLLLFVSLLSHLGLSLEVAESQNPLYDGITTSFCHNSSSGKFCFKTFRDKTNHTVRGSFQEASDWCKRHVPGFSLIAIDSHDSQKAIENFLGRHGLASETIIMDAQKLKNGNNRKWLWVNGHQTIPKGVRVNRTNDGACVQSVDGQSPVYCTDHVNAQHQYICEYSDLKSGNGIHRHKHKTYSAYARIATWYKARMECLRHRGDLASITDLEMIQNWTRLTENPSQRYWIGLHRNQWIWKSTGITLTYINWEAGFPEESSDKQCICFSPNPHQCGREKDQSICNSDRKWTTCNCDKRYAFVCQKEDKFDASTTNMVVTRVTLQSNGWPTRRNSYTRSANATSTSTKTTIATTPITAVASISIATTPILTTTSTKTSIATTPITAVASISIATTPILTTTSTKTSNATTPVPTTTSTKISIATSLTTSSTTSITTSSTTQPSTTVIPTAIAYTQTIAGKTAIETSGKTLSTSTVTHKPSNYLSENQAFDTSQTGSSSKTVVILLIVLLLMAIVFIIVAVVVVIRKRKRDRRNDGPSTKNTTQNELVSPVYATVAPSSRPPESTAPPGNTIYADLEMTQQPTPFNNIIYISVQPTNGIYAELNKPLKSPPSKGEAVRSKQQSPIYQDAIEVKPGAESGGVATQDPSAVYAEPVKLKKTSDGRNDGSQMKNAMQNETVSSVYATVFPNNNGPSEGIAQAADNPIYADIEITQQPKPSNNIIYASVQPTNVIYAELNKPMKSLTQKDESVQEQGPIYQDAIEVKPGAESGGVATQDPSAIYAEPMKNLMKKSS